MTITLQEQHELAIDMNFVNRLRQALLSVAYDVLDETEADYDLYQARESLSKRLIQSPLDNAKRAAYTLATQSTSADHNDISDSALLSFVTANYNRLAGYNPNAPEQPV